MLKLPPTIRVRANDRVKFDYQILKFDEMSNNTLPLDLTGMTVTVNLLPDESATYLVESRACDMLDETTGFITCEFSSGETATPGMYQLEFKVSSTDYNMTFPQFEHQWMLII